MSRFIEGQDRGQVTLLPECLDDYIAEDNTVRIVDAFISELDMVALGFEGATPAVTGRPSYHPADMLKIYLYGYLNRIASSRRLERECQRNVELMWLTCRLKTRVALGILMQFKWPCEAVAFMRRYPVEHSISPL